MYSFPCPAFDHALRSTDKQAGLHGRCKRCGRRFKLPPAPEASRDPDGGAVTADLGGKDGKVRAVLLREWEVTLGKDRKTIVATTDRGRWRHSSTSRLE